MTPQGGAHRRSHFRNTPMILQQRLKPHQFRIIIIFFYVPRYSDYIDTVLGADRRPTDKALTDHKYGLFPTQECLIIDIHKRTFSVVITAPLY